jgi:TRAP-type C4-dicarboxylate transport system substrate-binding protein
MDRPKHLLRALTLLCAALALWPVLAQTPAPYKLRIVGGLAGLHQYTRNEEPFWTQTLARLSAGKFNADIVPFDRAGVPGAELLRLIQLGVVPFGTVLMSFMSSQHPEYGAPDLAGLNPDIARLKVSVAAFRPYLEKQLRERHGVELLALYAYPAQVVFCQKPLTGLADLAGRRIRVSSATQADFVAAWGAIPVHTAFADLLTQLKSGNIECAITGSMSGNTLGLQDVTSHVHALPITWGLSVFGANQAAWNALPPELRALLRRELPALEAAIWAESERETAQGLACNQGASTCNTGRKGQMVVVPLSAQDEQRRQALFTSTVLTRWLQRCPTRCAQVWDQTVGAARAIPLPAP